MKHLIAILSLLALSVSSYSQIDKFSSEYEILLQHLSSENWENSEKACKKLLSYTESVDSMEHQKKVLRYIYIYTTAGLLNEQKLTKKQAISKVKHLRGKEMVLPAHPFNSSCYVNCTHLSDKANTFFTGVNNAKGTSIFSFEYIEIKDGIKETEEQLEGKHITLSGTLNEISVEGNMLPRFKLRFIKGDYKISE